MSIPLSPSPASSPQPFVPLPRLLPAVPPPGRKAIAQPFAGSADALALAQAATDAAQRRQLLAVVCADALAAQRLAAEIAWFAPALKIAVLPDWETLPYDHFSPHQDLVSERLATLYRMSRGDCDVVIVAATTALYRFAPPSYLAAFTFFIEQGETLDVDRLRSQLALAGYQHVTQVVSPGEFGIRGGLIDLFPMGSPLPYRIDLFDNQIESIRTFDVDSQRTVYPVPRVRLLPAREFPQDEAGRTRFRGRFREVFEGDPSKSSLYKDVSNGIMPAGIEYYLPLFFDATATLAEYLPLEALVCLHGDVTAAFRRFWEDTDARYRLLRGDRTRPLLAPHELFVSEDEFHRVLKPFARIELSSERSAPSGGQTSPGSTDTATEPPIETGDDAAAASTAEASIHTKGSRRAPATLALPPVQVDRRADDPLRALKRHVTATRERVLIAAESLGRRETMQQYFAEYGFKPAVVADWAEFIGGDASPALVASPLHAGFVWPAANVALITETELYAAVVRRPGKRDARRSNVDAMLRDLSEVRIGDPVVHEQHGIGRYLGLTTLDLGDGPNEFLHLLYANDAKLYVPVSSLHLISRYSGASPDAAPLHELGSGQWDKAKKKAAQRAHDTAAELLNLYAQRAARQGHAFKYDLHEYEAFAAGFGFEETPDQAAAIEAVIRDLTSGKPMDRLVCGDVGFGKTEVALRAAFVAVADGKQVAVLVPTTLLVEQHFQTFSDRFADLPVKLAELSRFRSAAEAKTVLEGLASGRIDLVIGTHKLIQRDVKFQRLGLVVIDEEHRFGVRQKEQLKRLRAEVDVLTLTATPIPRTLAMSLEGLRDFSVIATAPERRLCDQDLRRAILARHRERSLPARAQARRADLLPAQRHRHDRHDGTEARGADARGAHRDRARPDARARAGARDARFLPAAIQPAAVLDHHRDRHRRADRQYDHHSSRRQVRPRAASPAARPRRSLAPPGVRLPADAARGGAVGAGEEAARGDTADGGPRLRLLSRDARPGNPGRRRSPRRRAVGRDAADRLPALYRNAQGRRRFAAFRTRAESQRPDGSHHRDQPARSGAVAGDVLQRRARATGALQAAGQLRHRG